MVADVTVENRDWRWLVGGLAAVAATILIALGVSAFAIGRLDYGICLFVAVPFFIGFISTALIRLWGPRPISHCIAWATLAGFGASGAFLILGWEGLICVLMSLPLGLPIVLLGAVAGYLLLHRSALIGPVSAVCLSIAICLGTLYAESNIPSDPPIYTVVDSLEIVAPRDKVWRAIVGMNDLPVPQDLLFRIGIACPVRTEILGEGVGATRKCTLSTGPLLEEISEWQPGRRLAWRGLQTPPPLEEINPFWNVNPPHLHGFYRSLSGEFDLVEVSPERTLVIRRSSYEHNLYPAWYWRLWCDYAAHVGHRYVLDSLAREVEQQDGARPVL